MKRLCRTCDRTFGSTATLCPVCGRPLSISSGSVLAGKYTISRLVAAGGMSQVYLARQQGVVRDVALKVVSLPGDDPVAAEALRNEAFLAGKVAHPHVVTVFDHGRTPEGDLYLAMEYLQGVTLAEALAREGTMDYVASIRLLMQVAEALTAIHESGLVHQDLKPSNIFLVRSEGTRDFVKLLDFGVCVSARPSLRALVWGGQRSAGTPMYMSPEQAHGRPVDARSDLYSVGTILYEMLVGSPPFNGPDLFEEHRTAVPTPISIARPTVRIPRGLDDLLLRLLAKDPRQRPQSAKELMVRFRQMMPTAGGDTPRGEGVRDEPSGDSSWFEALPKRLSLTPPDYVERRKEHLLADDALSAAGENRGAVLWMVGEEGSGKSTFGSKVVAEARRRGFAIGSCPGGSLGPLMGAWRAATGDLIGIEGRSREEVRQALVAHCGPATTRDDPRVEGMMDLLFPGPAALELLRTDREAFGAYLSVAVERFLWAETASRPVLLFFDDFHLADALSVDFLDRFCRLLEERPTPMVLLITSRPVPRGAEGDRGFVHKAMASLRERGSLHRLSRLADREVDQLVDSMCPAPCDAPVKRLLRRAAAGNPLFAVQMCRHLGTSGALRIADGVIKQVPGVEPSVPQALIDLLSARIEGLRRQPPDGGQATDLVTRIAMLGPWAAVGTLWKLVDAEGRLDLRDRLDHLIDRLVAEGFVSRIAWAGDDFLVLVHPVMGEAILQASRDSSAQRLHLLAAQVLERTWADEPARVARDVGLHYFEAGFLDRATDSLVAAADAMVEDARLREASDLFFKAESCLDRIGLQRDPRMGHVLLVLAETLWCEGRYDDAGRRLDGYCAHGHLAPTTPDGLRALELAAMVSEASRRLDDALKGFDGLTNMCLQAGDRHRAAAAILRATGILLTRGENSAAHEQVKRAEALVCDEGLTRTMGLVHLMQGRVLQKIGSFDEAFYRFDRALEILSGPRDFADQAQALFFRGGLLMGLNRDTEALEVFRSGVGLCEQHGFARGLAGHLANLGSCLARVGRADEGRETILRSLSLRERMGDSLGVAQCLTALAHIALDRKDWATARDLSQKAIASNRKIGYVVGERVALCNLGTALIRLGEFDEAARRLTDCLATLDRDRALTRSIALAHELLGEVEAARGNPEAALRHRLNAINVFDRLQLFDDSEEQRRRIGQAG